MDTVQYARSFLDKVIAQDVEERRTTKTSANAARIYDMIDSHASMKPEHMTTERRCKMSATGFNDEVGFSEEMQWPREGSHHAIIVELYHWGMSSYQNQKPKDRYVYIYWLLDDFRSDGDRKGFPLEVWEYFNPTLGAPSKTSTFRKRIEKVHGFNVTPDHVKNKDKRITMSSLVGKPVELVIELQKKSDGRINPKVTSVFALDPAKVAPNFQGLLKAELAARPDEGGKGGGVYISHEKYVPYILRDKKTGSDTSFDPSQFVSDEDHEEASAPDGQPAVENATLDVPNF